MNEAIHSLADGWVASLAAAIEAAQAGDVLAPVDVVVPNGIAGVTLRRASAGPRGWANVRFSTLPQLAERLSLRYLAMQPGELRRPLGPEDRTRALQAAVDGSTAEGQLLAAARRQRATQELVGDVFAELEEAGVDPFCARPGLSPRANEILDLYAKYRDELTNLLTRRELFRVAATAVRAGEAPATQVVLLAYDEPNPAEQELLDALQEQERLAVLTPAPEPSPSPAELHLLVAPDGEEEVRLAIRATLEHLETTACRPERVGIVYVTRTPYARLLVEQLSVAGVPHHVPGQQTLAQSMPGRVVLGLLGLVQRDFPRADVLRWMADGPLLDVGGQHLPVARWERLSRDAGIDRGLSTWNSRLTAYAVEWRDKAAEKPDRAEAYEARAVAAEALLAEVTALHSLAREALDSPTWTDASKHLLTLLRRVLGTRRNVDRWGRNDDVPVQLSIEQQAYDSVDMTMRSLARHEGAISPTAIGDALTEAFDAALPSGTTLGRGVLVGNVRSFVGADLDLLLVLGCTEDTLPARQRESTVLRDVDRAALSPELATVASRRADEVARWQWALSSAPTVRLSYPRADTRAQRRQFPSPWFLAQATRLANAPVAAAQVDSATLEAPWFTSYASFEASLRTAMTFSSVHELSVATALNGRVDELAVTDARLARGLHAARSRAKGDFNAWSGNTGALPTALREDVDAHLSSTSLQTWATCPASHLFGSVLGIRALEDRAGEATIDARDKGTLIHGVLEAFLRPHLRTDSQAGIPPDQPWSQHDIEAATALLDTDAAALTERGLTGREVLWAAQLARLRRSLARVLAHDSALRRERRSTPVAVEAAFGRQGVDELVVTLPTQGDVPFAGYIDRIDATESGGLVVVDYKSGKGIGFDAIPTRAKPKSDADLLDRGRKLQLLLYSLAARQLQGLPNAAVQAWFWFVELGDLHRGGPVSAAHEDRLSSVLDLVVGGIRNGVYPAHPGDETWTPSTGQTWENCGYCPFDPVCPTTRAEQWSGVSTDPLVRAYAELVNPPKAAS